MPKIIMLVEGDKPILKEVMLIAYNYGLTIKDIQTQVVVNEGKNCLRVSIAFIHGKLNLVQELSLELQSKLKPIEISVTKS